MVKLSALDTVVASREAFDEHHIQTHLPLVKRLPTVKSLETSTAAAASTGHSPFCRIEQFAGTDITLYSAQSDP